MDDYDSIEIVALMRALYGCSMELQAEPDTGTVKLQQGVSPITAVRHILKSATNRQHLCAVIL